MPVSVSFFCEFVLQRCKGSRTSLLRLRRSHSSVALTCSSFQVSESVEVQAQNVASAGAAQQHLQELESLRLEAAKASGTIQLIR